MGLQRHQITEFSNKHEMEYMNAELVTEKRLKEQINDPLKRFDDNRLEILPHLQTKIKIHGRVLELAAGCCWLSSQLSKIDAVSQVVALDFSSRSLEVAAPQVMKILQANKNKMELVLGDFYKLDFKQDYFDFIFYDAALHHIETSKFKHVLNEAKRVLKKNGYLIAIRESFLIDLPWLRDKRRELFGKSEKEHGVTENIYTYKEWKHLFKDSSFDLRMVKSVPLTNSKNIYIYTVIKTLLKKMFPKILGADFYLIAQKID